MTRSDGRTSTRIRIGVDVGGTFTDFVLVDERRDLIDTGKRTSTTCANTYDQHLNLIIEIA